MSIPGWPPTANGVVIVPCAGQSQCVGAGRSAGGVANAAAAATVASNANTAGEGSRGLDRSAGRRQSQDGQRPLVAVRAARVNGPPCGSRL